MKLKIIFTLCLLPSLAFGHSSKIGAISIGHSWALPSRTPHAQVMMPLINTGVEADSLISASTPVADRIELHHVDQAVTEFALDPQKPFPMRAVAHHLELIGLKKPLEIGEIFPLTLTFKKAGKVTIEIFVAEKVGE